MNIVGISSNETYTLQFFVSQLLTSHDLNFLLWLLNNFWHVY